MLTRILTPLLRRRPPQQLRTMTTASNPLQKPLTIALLQLSTGPSKADNLQHALSQIGRAATEHRASLVVLPECFNSPYGTEHFPTYAEPIPDDREGSAFSALSAAAKQHGVTLIGGSIPEKVTDGKLYNTSMVFSPRGELLATHRKIHLFDIDIPGKITFRESDVLTGGCEPTLVDVDGFGKVGVAICYDVRFPELAMMAARKGAFAMVYPGAFNMTTGPMHWELLARSRAVDNQIYVGMCSPARDPEGKGYVAWGETMVVDPSGAVMKKLGAEEGMVVVELLPETIAKVRKSIPVGTQRRFDVYADVARAPPQES